MIRRRRDSVEAHLIVVFTALAVSCGAQRTGLTIGKSLRPLRSATRTISDYTVTVAPCIPRDSQQMLDVLTSGGHQSEAAQVRWALGVCCARGPAGTGVSQAQHLFDSPRVVFQAVACGPDERPRDGGGDEDGA